MTKEIRVVEPAQREGAGTVYSDWVNVGYYNELIMNLAVTAQGTYTDETLDITIQGEDGDGNVFELGSYTQVGNVVSSVPYCEPLKFTNFGRKIRAKIVMAGTDCDYTLSVLGFGKRYCE